jgi:hypothetical protein
MEKAVLCKLMVSTHDTLRCIAPEPSDIIVIMAHKQHQWVLLQNRGLCQNCLFSQQLPCWELQIWAHGHYNFRLCAKYGKRVVREPHMPATKSY